MDIRKLTYRTKTYIAGDWTNDFDLIEKLKEWNKNDNLALSFTDVHELTSSNDNSNNCSIKKSLRNRLNVSKTFVLIVGDYTNKLRSGACYLCKYYCNISKSLSFCSLSHPIDNRSYVQYECEMAVKDYNEGKIKNIVVIYNGLHVVDKNKCPEVIRNIGIHIPSDRYEEGKLYWNYPVIKNAICR